MKAEDKVPEETKFKERKKERETHKKSIKKRSSQRDNNNVGECGMHLER